MGHPQISLNLKSGHTKRLIFTFKIAWCDWILKKRAQNCAPSELDMKVITSTAGHIAVRACGKAKSQLCHDYVKGTESYVLYLKRKQVKKCPFI